MVNKTVPKVHSVSMMFISVSKRLIEFNHIYYISELSVNLIFIDFIKHQSYICCDMHVDAGNYFEFLFSTNNDLFYANLTCNNIYILFDSPPTFDNVMNDQKYEAVAYVAVLISKTISIDYNSNAGSLKLFSCEEVEQLNNFKNSYTDFFTVFSLF